MFIVRVAEPFIVIPVTARICAVKFVSVPMTDILQGPPKYGRTWEMRV